MSRRLNYPPVQFVCSANIAKNYLLSQVQALDSPMPDVLHLFNLRTLTSAAVVSEKTKPNIAAEKLRPSTSALLILHRQVKPFSALSFAFLYFSSLDNTLVARLKKGYVIVK